MAWAAGFFEGEGWWGLTRHKAYGGRKESNRPRVMIGQKQLQPLLDFQRITGMGTIYSREGDVHRLGILDFEHIQALVCLFWKWMSPRRKAQALQMLTERTTNRPIVRTRATRCLRGHELIGDNLYIQRKTGNRSCRKCRAIRTAAQRARIAAEAIR